MPTPISAQVFPACAGMFLVVVAWAVSAWGFPRMRGDVPVVLVLLLSLSWFSPHARGCSWLRVGL